MPRTAGVAGGGAEKALEPATYRRCGGGGAGKALRHYVPADDSMCKANGGDTKCPLQVCQLSRSSESIHFLTLRSRSFIRSHQSPGRLLRSEARASDLLPDYPEYKTPILSHETHPNYLNTDNYTPFEAVS